MDSNSQNNIPILKVKKCRWCNFYFLTEVPNKLYCCDLHRERANRNNKKLWARQHREVHGLPENHNEVSKEAMERYREHWVNHFTFDKNNKSGDKVLRRWKCFARLVIKVKF